MCERVEIAQGVQLVEHCLPERLARGGIGNGTEPEVQDPVSIERFSGRDGSEVQLWMG